MVTRFMIEISDLGENYADGKDMLSDLQFEVEDLLDLDHKLRAVVTVESDSTSVVYAVGDTDPTPDIAEFCVAVSPSGNYGCTWIEGHSGVHVAGTGQHIAEVWE